MADGDPFRLLAARSEIGYTDRVDRAMTDEPEAVSAHCQRMLTASAQRARETQEYAAWVGVRDAIRREVDSLSGAAFAPMRSDLRVILRQVERIDKRVAA